MSHITGDYGQVDIGSSTIAEANYWEMTIVTDSHQTGTFGSAWKWGDVGKKSATGTIRGLYDDSSPIEDTVFVGDSVTLKLYRNDTASKCWTVPAKITSLNPVCDGDTSPPQGWSMEWISNGTITKPSG